MLCVCVFLLCVILSFILIASFAIDCRGDQSRVEVAEQMLEAFQVGTGEFTSTSVNVLMCAYAERGEVNNTLALLDEFKRNDWTPNADSFSFALESVGKATGRMTNNKNLRMSPTRRESLIGSWMQATDNILTMFEETQAQSSEMHTSHLIRNYVEFLCHADQVETATLLVNDLLERGDRSSVDNKALFRVAVANAEIGNFELARRLAEETSESLPFIQQKIDQIYQTTLIEQNLRERGEANTDGS